MRAGLSRCIIVCFRSRPRNARVSSCVRACVFTHRFYNIYIYYIYIQRCRHIIVYETSAKRVSHAGRIAGAARCGSPRNANSVNAHIVRTFFPSDCVANRLFHGNRVVAPRGRISKERGVYTTPPLKLLCARCTRHLDVYNIMRVYIDQA